MRKSHYKMTRDRRFTKNIPIQNIPASENSDRLDYFQVTLNTLKSLVSDNRIKRLLSLVLVELSSMQNHQQKFACQRTYISIVSWPIVAEGILRQLQLDLPRQQVYINGVRWNGNALSFLTHMEARVGPIWARWICAFANQAPAADLLLRVSQDAQARFGNNVFLRDHQSPLEIRIIHTKKPTLSISFGKSFQLVRFLDGELNLDKQILVDAEMTIEFLPHAQVTVRWEWGALRAPQNPPGIEIL